MHAFQACGLTKSIASCVEQATSAAGPGGSREQSKSKKHWALLTLAPVDRSVRRKGLKEAKILVQFILNLPSERQQR